jgi:hypothetical protein
MKKPATRTIDPLDGPVDFSRFGPLRRGHPGKGKQRTTTVRSVRLPDVLWRELERTARAKHLNVHQAMRAALLGWIRRAS